MPDYRSSTRRKVGRKCWISGYVGNAFGIMVVATIIRIGTARSKPLQFRHLSISRLSHEMRKTIAFLRAGGLITWMFITDGLLDDSSQSVMSFMPKHITEVAGISQSDYGVSFAILSMVAVLTNWLGGAFSDHYGHHISIAIGGFLCAIAFTLLAISTSAMSLVIGFDIIGVSGAFIQPAFASLLSHAAPKDRLGVMYGFFRSALGLVAIPAPSIGGTLYDRVSPLAT